jgi:hypothetical protein
MRRGLAYSMEFIGQKSSVDVDSDVGFADTMHQNAFVLQRHLSILAWKKRPMTL